MATSRGDAAPLDAPSAAPPAGLDVVIVSYRSEALLRDCLRSLGDSVGARPVSLHVIDNASGDGTAEMVAREFGDVELTACDRNLGFAAANNLAIGRSQAPYVLVLNPDTQVQAGTLDHLLELMDSRPEIGICGPRLVRPDGGFDHAARRSFPTPLSALGHFSGIGPRLRSGSLAAYRAPEVEAGPVDAVNGAFMLIRRSALEQVGGFDEGYWMYMEDLDLCYRFAIAGWVTWFEPSVSAVHVKGGTTGVIRPPRLNYAFHYGMYRFYRKFYAPERSAPVNAAIYLGIVSRLLVTTVAGLAARLTGRGRRPEARRPARE